MDKTPTDRQSTTKLVADLQPLVCVACNHAVPCWWITIGDQYAFGVHDLANRKEQKKPKRVILRKHKIANLVSQCQCDYVLQCQLFPRRCFVLERSQNVYSHVPATSYVLPPRAQTHSYARLPPAPWRGGGREWALGHTVTAPLTFTAFRNGAIMGKWWGLRAAFIQSLHR